MKNSEIKALEIEELNEKLRAEEDGIQKLKFAHAISPIENPMKIREAKKLIARLKTEIRAKELAK
ncbi:50S ribosomal protein L29 [Roseivirga misakiensis]|uniref:Large ribosomal subunit protein uL29 n=1 Tax=Roseivirga misakiensis TaxID=1563681 RepID=A0A1E5SKF1_9BACT|nr:50S ribosomal protein L29 [Roseivirga misakiensis]OEJ99581.1 50S ribosomal protein L29 [Roseivirga misakiensis]